MAPRKGRRRVGVGVGLGWSGGGVEDGGRTKIRM